MAQLYYYFGNKQTAFEKQSLWQIQDSKKLLQSHCFKAINFSPIKHLIMLKQIHSTQGIVADETSNPFVAEGDYLMTNQKNIALGIATADCLPIIFYDPQAAACAIIHAGWRGTLQHIVLKVLKHMEHLYITQPENLYVYFGPYSAACCYEVSPDFASYAEPQSIITKNKKNYFDVLTYNKQLLQSAGILPEHFNQEYVQCTMCNPEFCSYRRDKEFSLRQLSFAALI